MTSTNDRYAKLVERLYDLTKEKKLNWKINDFNDEIECKLSDYTVVLKETANAEDTPFILLKIRNTSGVDIDSFNDGTINHISPPTSEYATFWNLMSALLNMAHRQASGADDAIDRILQDLDDKELPF